ncbi:MAG: hypothetical protein CVT49_14240 [candidate division Zixibacteria bacterium HGW-Zixibacteria-1]|nr:MAG: hypothetical protein CVT49_14240 [candidate division Zixibacteria bacterium HGW-Zixibacteria-1]
MVSRRQALKFIGSIPVMIYLPQIMSYASAGEPKPFPPETEATIYRATGPDPGEITRRMVDSLGGIGKFIDKDNIVILKVNSQWWNQGMTNTDVIAEFVRIILEIPGFAGEIVLADNNQSETPGGRGWTTDKRNGRFNYNELVGYFNDKGHPNVTKYHWHPAGPNPNPLQFGGSGNSVVGHPSEGDGYVWQEDLYYECPHGNRCLLAYPIFTSAFSGVTIDLKNGAFRDGQYTGQPVKFINFAAMNHHGPYAGVTAAVKNYMGVVDMSCGYPGPTPDGTFNTHHIGASATFRWMAHHRRTIRMVPFVREFYERHPVFRFRYTAGVLGKYMREIRRADLNIITAIRIGWGDRLDPAMAYQADTVLASTDPVALDYWATANIMLPATIEVGAPDYYRKLNNPDIADGPLHTFLQECRRELGGTMDPARIEIVES